MKTKSTEKMPSRDLQLANAIRQLRRDAGLTQGQLARAIGIAPTSIYRYEAGSKPDPASLFALTRYADVNGFTAARNFFLEMLGPTAYTEGAWPVLQAIRTHTEERDKDSQALIEMLQTLSETDKLDVLTFLLFLQQNKDVTSHKIIEFLLQPWRDEARRRFVREPSAKLDRTKEAEQHRPPKKSSL